MSSPVAVFQAQPGPQTAFLAAEHVDIVFFGGAAGGGKTYAILLETVRNQDNPRFSSVVFRRNAVQVRNPGGLLDESRQMYPVLGAVCKDMTMEWTFPSGSKVKFAHLEHEKTVLDWMGAQIALICFDEVTHFTEAQFWYMLSRNRSMSGIPGRMRATCNPDADSWVRELLDWWIGPDGYPIKERSGVVRWFIRVEGQVVWGETREELCEKYSYLQPYPKSFTFIYSLLEDNKILMEKDPAYKANLLAQGRVEAAKLYHGNWNARLNAGAYFARNDFKVLPVTVEIHALREIRFWDRAGTKPHEGNKDPDWTRGIKLIQTTSGVFVVTDMVSLRGTPMENADLIRRTAMLDGPACPIGLERDPGSAGINDIDNMRQLLAGFTIVVGVPSKNKAVRAGPVSTQVQGGRVLIIEAPWNKEFLTELEAFPTDGVHDDIVDALSGAFNALVLGPDAGPSICDVIDDTNSAAFELFTRWGVTFPS